MIRKLQESQTGSERTWLLKNHESPHPLVWPSQFQEGQKWSSSLGLEFAEAPQGPVGNSCSLFLNPIPGQMLEQCQGLTWGRERGKGEQWGVPIPTRAWPLGIWSYLLAPLFIPSPERPSAETGRFLVFWRNLSSKRLESWQLLIIPCQWHISLPLPSWDGSLVGKHPAELWNGVTSMGTVCRVHGDVQKDFSHPGNGQILLSKCLAREELGSSSLEMFGARQDKFMSSLCELALLCMDLETSQGPVPPGFFCESLIHLTFMKVKNGKNPAS